MIGYYQDSDEKDVKETVKAAEKAQREWKGFTAAQRGNILKSISERLENEKEELAKNLTLEEGKILSEATGEVRRSIDIFHYYALNPQEKSIKFCIR